MNESETRAELIDPMLKEAGWGVLEGTKILRELNITAGRIQTGGGRSKSLKVDYVLVYKGIKLAVIEAKSNELGVGEGVAQAKQYAEKLKLETTYSTNGKEIYQICMKTGNEGIVSKFLSPEELWDKTYSENNIWREKFSNIAFEDIGGTWQLRYYQEIAVRNALESIAKSKDRILLTLATGTGKTSIAFQISWKLFQSRWNLNRDGKRRPRILFLADRNILANQAFNSFSAFPVDALVRIKTTEIKKSGKVPTNGSIFFTIFQTFMSGSDKDGNPAPYFGDYPADYFDLIIIDECHRGGAKDESNWRGILEYFSPAVQLGLTATPKRKNNVDTYEYFGEPVYIYSLKEGINDGFLTPFKVKRIKTTLDDYIYISDDQVLEGETEEGKLYKESDFNRNIEIRERENYRIKLYLKDANPNDKAIIFCATQDHAAVVRDLVNQSTASKDPNYCVRVTANDGEIGEQFLREFQDNEKTIPTILTTSQKLSTGVDARNIRNIVLMRPVNSMIEFKQIIGRGTRLFDGKDFFTIYDFVDAYYHFADPEWDGEPIEAEISDVKGTFDENKPKEQKEVLETEKRQKLIIKLRDGKEREIDSMISTSFWSEDGRPISAEEFLNNLFGEISKLFKDEDELKTIWSNPISRRTLLDNLEASGFTKQDLLTVQKLINMENSDLFDVLDYILNGNYISITREERVATTKAAIFEVLNKSHHDFIEYVLQQYIDSGVEELDQEKLPTLLINKYKSIADAKNVLGEISLIRNTFIDFQSHLYH